MSEQETQTGRPMPRVTIGMPVYNGARYLPAAIKAFQAQSFADFEIVLSDNASTDRTAEIAQAFAASDPRIRYIRQPENIGYVGNYGYVLGEARGELFQWAAHDDLWRPFWLEQAVAALDADPQIQFAFPSFEIRDKYVGLTERYDADVFSFVESDLQRERLLTFFALNFSHQCNIVYSLFRRDYIAQNLGLQDLSDDGVLAALILSASRGRIVQGYPFIKKWSLLRAKFRSMLPSSSRMHASLDAYKMASLERMKPLFPDYIDDIRHLYGHLKPGLTRPSVTQYDTGR